jgi:hypothetical protein
VDFWDRDPAFAWRRSPARSSCNLALRQPN